MRYYPSRDEKKKKEPAVLSNRGHRRTPRSWRGLPPRRPKRWVACAFAGERGPAVSEAPVLTQRSFTWAAVIRSPRVAPALA